HRVPRAGVGDVAARWRPPHLRLGERRGAHPAGLRDVHQDAGRARLRRFHVAATAAVAAHSPAPRLVHPVPRPPAAGRQPFRQAPTQPVCATSTRTPAGPVYFTSTWLPWPPWPPMPTPSALLTSCIGSEPAAASRSVSSSTLSTWNPMWWMPL